MGRAEGQSEGSWGDAQGEEVVQCWGGLRGSQREARGGGSQRGWGPGRAGGHLEGCSRRR